MDTRGRHLLVEYRRCPREILDDPVRVEQLMREAALAAGAKVLAAQFHRFRPQGVSGVLLIEESHLSIHTWPEAGYAAVDFYTCGPCDPRLAHDHLARGLQAVEVETLLVQRGATDADMQGRHQRLRLDLPGAP